MLWKKRPYPEKMTAEKTKFNVQRIFYKNQKQVEQWNVQGFKFSKSPIIRIYLIIGIILKKIFAYLKDGEYLIANNDWTNNSGIDN